MLLIEQLLSAEDIVDAEGRPLAEHRAAPAARVAHTELKTCPYPGSRYKNPRPMNVSALAQMTSRWDDVLDGLAYANTVYRRGTSAHAFSFVDAWRIAEVGRALPFHFLHRRGASGAALPPAIAGVYKVVLGVSGAFANVALATSLTPGQAPPLPSLDGLLAFIEERQLLIGTEEVCAGPATNIRRALEVMLHGAYTKRDEDIAIGHERTARLIGDDEGFALFSEAFGIWGVVRMLARLLLGVVGQDLLALLDRVAPDAARSVTERGPASLAPIVALDATQREMVLGHALHAWMPRELADPALRRVLARLPRVFAGDAQLRHSLRARWRAPGGDESALPMLETYVLVHDGLRELLASVKSRLRAGLGFAEGESELWRFVEAEYVPPNDLAGTLLRVFFGAHVRPGRHMKLNGTMLVWPGTNA